MIGGMTTTATPRRRVTAIRAARLFDGTSATVLTDPLVILDGTRIVAVDRAVAPPPDADVTELGDVTLLPGLIDTHVHLCFDASADPVSALEQRDDTQAIAAMRAAARSAVLGGVTTVRDLGDRNYLALELAGAERIPMVLAAGPPITTPGGHCHFLGGVVRPGIDAVRAAVRQHAERGVHVIKVMASGGLMTPGTRQEQAQFSTDELRAAVDEAHRFGLPVTAHAHGAGAVAAALDAGVDGLEHVTFWSEHGVDSPRKLIERIAARRVAVGTTAGFASAHGYQPDPEMMTRMPAIVANMRSLYEAGAVLLAGTDAGINPMKPHDAQRFAVPEMAMLAMTPVQALVAATSDAAKVCGLAHRKGRLGAGFDADLIAVAGNPLEDPAAIHDLRAVYLGGQLVRADA
jgi:imidazolonepropionase-like amidohydrolase